MRSPTRMSPLQMRMWVCRMFDRPCAKNAAFDDVYISLGFVQGPETNTGAKTESTFKH